ncbi:MGH1-like glycoside hydrolase domain-containing protein [Demequina muriae]|uniref:Mannosylglycerate hydrolase MGH1-like glycoside hydrolase domain-containing protein n=1 Tax=Demequina muriae TaxID=3051664 RepID=A0ABT8GIG8_9MICO|nr:hypothetical protein [Demequina sp. EGI L300058]MDN4481071.1 hypothetical protein [Demequina sp. EGI L300058]
MNSLDDARSRLHAASAAARAGLSTDHPLSSGLLEAGVRFSSVGGTLEARWDQALRELAQCISPFAGGASVVSEGGVYHGAWIESTGTASTEVLTRFAPEVSEATHRLFATHMRDDGLMPYKVTSDGPGFSQIQIVSPLARAVWNHHRLCGGAPDHLRTMYEAMARMDAWLARHRDTRGTGGVEAFCTFDTGHDLSPRFWGVADRCVDGDATRWDDSDPLLPLVAPDLTANVACQRSYLALIAEELGEDGEPWRERARTSEASLWRECFDEEDEFFYDMEATGTRRRLQSDVLLRVLACEIGDGAMVSRALERYLMNRTKFLAGYGLTSIALDDPRFDRDFSRNSWGGPTNALTMLRTPAAFEHQGRVAELGMLSTPMIEALAAADRFPQCFDPWSGDAGFTEVYSPAILWFLDAIERHCGILPQPDGELWCSALAPTRMGHGTAADAVAYARTHAGVAYELAMDDHVAQLWRDGDLWLTFPRGWRIVLDAAGDLDTVVGLSPAPVSGDLTIGPDVLSLTLAGNDRVAVHGGTRGGRTSIGVITPRS